MSHSQKKLEKIFALLQEVGFVYDPATFSEESVLAVARCKGERDMILAYFNKHREVTCQYLFEHISRRLYITQVSGMVNQSQFEFLNALSNKAIAFLRKDDAHGLRELRTLVFRNSRQLGIKLNLGVQ